MESRVDGIIDSDLDDENRTQSNEVLREAWGDRPYIAAGGMDGATANEVVEKYGDLVAFGRHFIANVNCAFISWWSHFLKHIVARTPLAPETRSLTDAL